MSPTLVPTLDELEVEFEQSLSRWHKAVGTADQALNAATDELFLLCAAIEQLPAQTLPHVCLKARALRWMLDDVVMPHDTQGRITEQLISAILDGVPS